MNLDTSRAVHGCGLYPSSWSDPRAALTRAALSRTSLSLSTRAVDSVRLRAFVPPCGIRFLSRHLASGWWGCAAADQLSWSGSWPRTERTEATAFTGVTEQ